MRNLFLLLVLLSYGATALAQGTPQGPSTHTLSAGPALPMGSFSSTSFDREYPAFAGVGTLLQLSYVRSVKPNIGLGASVGYRLNPFLENKFANPNDALVQQMESRPWQTAYVLADVQYQMPLYSDGWVYIRGSVGGSFNRSDNLRVQTPFGTITRSSDISFTPAYGISSGLRGLYDRFSIGLETSLLYMRPTFEIASKQGELHPIKQDMNSISFCVSLGYML